MEKSILNPFQKIFLSEIVKTSLADDYYLSGGTALAEFYLHHRLSEDLDFFTQKEQDLDGIKKFIIIPAKKAGITKIEFQKGFGLFTFFLHEKGKKKIHKVDFGQYPFEPMEELKKVNNLKIESLYDIAVNKVHTIAFRPRLRDFIDLYFILKTEKEWKLNNLLKISFQKFEMKTDPLQLGENLLMVKSLKDMPVMIRKINMPDIESFFLKEAESLKNKIWKQ